eukprot:g1964.t1
MSLPFPLKTMKLNVRTETGETFQLKDASSSTVGMLKERLRETIDEDSNPNSFYLLYPSSYFFVVNGKRVLDNTALGRLNLIPGSPGLLIVKSRTYRKEIRTLSQIEEEELPYTVLVKSSSGARYKLRLNASDTAETIKDMLLTAVIDSENAPNCISYPSCYHLVVPKTGEIVLPNRSLWNCFGAQLQVTLIIVTNARLVNEKRQLDTQGKQIQLVVANQGRNALHEALASESETQAREEQSLWAFGLMSTVSNWVYRKWYSMRDAFRAFDNDKSGYITTNEFVTTIRMINLQLNSEQERSITNFLDPNGDGVINYREFLAACQRDSMNQLSSLANEPKIQLETREERRIRDALSQVNSSIQRNYRSLRKAFLSTDKDRSGKIDPSELQWLLQRMGIDVVDEELHALLTLLDKNGDGLIDYNEFAKGVYKGGSIVPLPF